MGLFSDIRNTRSSGMSSSFKAPVLETPTLQRPTSYANAYLAKTKNAISPRKRQPEHRDSHTHCMWERSQSSSSKRASLSMESSFGDDIPARYYETSRQSQSPRSRRGQAKLVASTMPNNTTPTPPQQRSYSPGRPRVHTHSGENHATAACGQIDWREMWKVRGRRTSTRQQDGRHLNPRRIPFESEEKAERRSRSRTPRQSRQRSTTPHGTSQRSRASERLMQTTNASFQFDRTNAPKWQVLLFDSLTKGDTKSPGPSRFEKSVRQHLRKNKTTSYGSLLVTCRDVLGLRTSVLQRPLVPHRPEGDRRNFVEVAQNTLGRHRFQVPKKRGRSLVQSNQVPNENKVAQKHATRRGRSEAPRLKHNDDVSYKSLGKYSRVRSAANCDMYYDQSDYERIARACGWKLEDMFPQTKPRSRVPLDAITLTTTNTDSLKKLTNVSPTNTPSGSPRTRRPAAMTTRTV